MKSRSPRSAFPPQPFDGVVAIVCVALLAFYSPVVLAQQAEPATSSPEQAPKIPNDHLDSLVAPIALYPDPLLSQVLVASTYPLEIIQLQQWLEKHKDLKDHALVAAVEKENWDPSIQGMAALPDAVKQLAENIKWTTDLGNAFLAQQSDVMDAVQRMRMKAKDAGNLKSNERMKVETKVVETKTVVVIEQANPKVVYVPSYNPVVVYGAPVYPYPAIYYPPATGAVLAFGAGIAIGAAWGGGWGYGCGWGSSSTVKVNVNNTYNYNYNKANINRPSTLPAGGNGNWQHNPQHRGGAPYANRQTATQYGGTARGDSMSTRQANASQQLGLSNRQQPSVGDRSATATSRPTSNIGSNAGANANNMGLNRGGSNAGASAGNMGLNRGGSNAGASAGNMGLNRQQPSAIDRSAAGASRPGSNAGASAGNMGLNRGSSGGNNIGSRQVSGNDFSRNTSAFGGASNRSSAQASSARGASSMGGSRGGGGGRPAGGGRRR
jgi:hypothetical protein